MSFEMGPEMTFLLSQSLQWHADHSFGGTKTVTATADVK